jgi:hypothetical protein
MELAASYGIEFGVSGGVGTDGGDRRRDEVSYLNYYL